MRLVKRAGEIARHYQLLNALILKDFDSRYAGSFIGILWTQAYPLLLLLVYSFVFSMIFKTDTPRFPLFLFVGIAVWNFFSSSVLLGTNSILANAHLVTRISFPRELVTISSVLIALIDLGMSHAILLVGAVLYGVLPSWSWLALPLIVFLLLLFCLGLALTLATAVVYLRDVRFLVEVGVTMLMFLSAVFYSQDAVPDSVAWMFKINPLALTISAYRGAFLDGVWPGASTWLVLGALALLALWIGIETFDRGQRGFADAL
ncbi:MAG: ABC transporter permease [Chloroflexi bacterium]|nr:ABC transporter permease [Chloroflexota bacterium]